MASLSNPVICSVARGPIGRFTGGLSPLRAVDLGGQAIAAAMARGGLGAAALCGGGGQGDALAIRAE